MSRDIEGVQAGVEPVLRHRPLPGEAADNAQVREVPGVAIWDGAGRHARRPRVANDFKYCGRHGCTGSVGRGMWATRGPPRVGKRENGTWYSMQMTYRLKGGG